MRRPYVMRPPHVRPRRADYREDDRLMDNRRNYYRILHVQPDAPTEVIRMSYLTLMRRLKMHPDLGGDHARAVLINEAFATLVDPARRAAYDRTLARERALPGYRADPAHRDAGGRHAESTTGVVDPYACPFCGTAFAPADMARPDARCSFCNSPLYPASHHAHEVSTRRAIERTSRQMPVRFFLSWPQHPGYEAMTEDISPVGMRLVCALDLVPNERIKIDCDLCEAVAVVRHARAAGRDAGAWSAGIEFLTLWIRPVRGVFVSTHA